MVNGNPIVEGFIEAIRLIVTLNPQVVEITIRSLYISLTATFFAALIALPIGALIYFYEFRGKRAVVSTLQTLYALPTVIVGLLVFLFLSNIGPFGFLRLLYTPGGMIVAQTILIIPLLMGLTVAALSGIDRDKRYTITALGASRLQTVMTIIAEARFAVMAGVLLGFGRAIAEVGTVMIVGGNIRGATRVLTTAIALNTSMANYSLSIALGIILLGVALGVNIVLSLVQRR
ncbi:MAG: Binding-protein-dependent transport systems inner membrane component [Methanoculleus marisnigri]|jgi:ABC-type tungstate transport system, periplasmic component|uniref:Binding-protein-dependent transport systems inner membrane component n=1 Tax=Methanoculleus marisnigri TaxID=2198 RepID=A0A117MED5_9EURY|nr:ABC transporter permease [Methanoculleus marisnigri]KUK99322.1 MAG: Binding-protein-dependent transport systems inner membrane component [Methanoculleus marisnigri]